MERLQEIEHWLRREVGLARFDIAPASADASFRRYFRVSWNGDSWIVMDAPPPHEDCEQFVAVARALRGLGLNVPEVLAADIVRGFLLLTDLGTRQYLDVLDDTTVERLYGDALSALLVLQACGPADQTLLPAYDRVLLMREMELFREWLVGRHLGLVLPRVQQAVVDRAYQILADSALEQTQVCVHRDYHSRNLMVYGSHNPGILDFQDAVVGPVTYDLVSLLRDCYIRWPRERVEQWAMGYHDLAVQSGVVPQPDEERFLRWFDLMGIQRHLKAIGIFARLNTRDNKPAYLKDIPRTMDYVVEVCAGYPEFHDLRSLILEVILPSMDERGALLGMQ